MRSKDQASGLGIGSPQFSFMKLRMFRMVVRLGGGIVWIKCPWEECSLKVGISEGLHHPSLSPDPFPDRLQCLDLSIVSNATCQAVFPGRVTENMVCAGGEAGKDACQVNQLRVMLTTGERKKVMEKGRKVNGLGGGSRGTLRQTGGRVRSF